MTVRAPVKALCVGGPLDGEEHKFVEPVMRIPDTRGTHLLVYQVQTLRRGTKIARYIGKRMKG